MTCPSIGSLVEEWFQYCAREGISLRDCRIYKSDVQSAFPQFDIAPECAILFFVRVTAALFMVLTVGMFGWLGFPIVFAVISRALERVCRRSVKGVMRFYVDDAIGLARAEVAASDQCIVEEKILLCFGEGSVAVDKSISPLVIQEVIGWLVNLLSESLRPSDKGIRKLLWAFVVLGNKPELTRKEYQRLASLAERYSQGLRGLRPFVSALHGMQNKMSRAGPYAKKRPNSSARFCIVVW
jgi:hypothetical protein